jgi:hypothetical protein
LLPSCLAYGVLRLACLVSFFQVDFLSFTQTPFIRQSYPPTPHTHPPSPFLDTLSLSQALDVFNSIFSEFSGIPQVLYKCSSSSAMYSVKAC